MRHFSSDGSHWGNDRSTKAYALKASSLPLVVLALGVGTSAGAWQWLRSPAEFKRAFGRDAAGVSSQVQTLFGVLRVVLTPHSPWNVSSDGLRFFPLGG